MIMGSTHYNDIVSMGNLVNKLSKRTLDKIQFVLCGFDLRGKVSSIDVKTNQLKQRDLKPEETVWVSYEKFLTDNYSTIDGNYANFLKMYIPNVQYPMVSNEPYMRCWTKDMDHYFEHYNNVDVLLAPLQNNTFNRMKSQLKAIECCFSKTALVASNVGPYTLDLVNFLGGNGKTNENGNAILIDEQKNHKMWHKTIERLADDPDTVKLLQNNIHESLKEKFDLNNVVKLRDKIYDTILTAG
jgi:glycosyltransferase involved in cell wall biosynthesis